MALDAMTFDQDASLGWRQLEKDGCYQQAASLIERYEDLHGHRYNLEFHAAQLYLKSGQYASARARLLKAYRADLPTDFPLKWNAFVDAYVAFIDRDVERLAKARADIEAGAGFWGNKANLRVVETLARNPDQPYLELFPQK